MLNNLDVFDVHDLKLEYHLNLLNLHSSTPMDFMSSLIEHQLNITAFDKKCAGKACREL